LNELLTQDTSTMTKPTLNAAFGLRLASAVLAILILSLGAIRAVSHLNDLSGMRHIPGDWMALAQALNRGVFYPPLQEDGYYAGTRYMPLFFCVIAGAERLLGNYLLATKLVALLAFLALAAATFAVGRRLTDRVADALALTALVLAFNEGQMALLLPHADGLAVALSVWGLFAVSCTTPRSAQLVVAALLFTLAFGAKFSAVAAPLAALGFLLPREPKRGSALALGFIVLAVAGLVAIYFASQGRFVDNFRALGSGGMTFDSVKIGLPRLLIALFVFSTSCAFVAPILVPLALWTIYQNFRTTGLTIWDWYFVASIVTSLLTFMSPGTDINHLLELEVASVLVVGQRLRAPAAPSVPAGVAGEAPVTRGLLLVPLLIGCCVLAKHPDKQLLRDWFGNPPAKEAAATSPAKDWFWQERAPSFADLAEQLPANPHLLTEDSTPVVLLGQRPVVMDAFAFKIMAERHLIDDADLVRRIERREFNALVMLRRVDNPKELLENFHFGRDVNDALRRQYRFDRQIGQYYLYRPRSWPRWHWWGQHSEEADER
jgi:hypothetical protein